MIAALALLLLAGEAAWIERDERYADAKACVAGLTALAQGAAGEGYDAVKGPYPIADGDVRIHTVKAEGNGHRIHEYRCLAERMSARSWHHSMEEAEDDLTIEAMARNAEWLKKGAPEQ